MVTTERQLTQAAISPVINQAEHIVASVAASMSSKKERFSDRKLGREIGILIAIRRKQYDVDESIANSIIKHASRFDVRSTKKIRHAVKEMTDELRWDDHPSAYVTNLINIVKDQCLRNSASKGGV
jgi:hypothetical protein